MLRGEAGDVIASDNRRLAEQFHRGGDFGQRQVSGEA